MLTTADTLTTATVTAGDAWKVTDRTPGNPHAPRRVFAYPTLRVGGGKGTFLRVRFLGAHTPGGVYGVSAFGQGGGVLYLDSVYGNLCAHVFHLYTGDWSPVYDSEHYGRTVVLLDKVAGTLSGVTKVGHLVAHLSGACPACFLTAQGIRTAAGVETFASLVAGLTSPTAQDLESAAACARLLNVEDEDAAAVLESAHVEALEMDAEETAAAEMRALRADLAAERPAVLAAAALWESRSAERAALLAAPSAADVPAETVAVSPVLLSASADEVPAPATVAEVPSAPKESAVPAQSAPVAPSVSSQEVPAVSVPLSFTAHQHAALAAERAGDLRAAALSWDAAALVALEREDVDAYSLASERGAAARDALTVPQSAEVVAEVRAAVAAGNADEVSNGFTDVALPARAEVAPVVLPADVAAAAAAHDRDAAARRAEWAAERASLAPAAPAHAPAPVAAPAPAAAAPAAPAAPVLPTVDAAGNPLPAALTAYLGRLLDVRKVRHAVALVADPSAVSPDLSPEDAAKVAAKVRKYSRTK